MIAAAYDKSVRKLQKYRYVYKKSRYHGSVIFYIRDNIYGNFIV